MKISVIHPSYGRPELAFKTATKWLTSVIYYETEYILCLSKQDKELEIYRQMFALSLKGIFKIIVCEDANMVKQMNLAASKATGDLIIAISDDFDCPQNWDKLLLDKLQDKKDFVVRIDDGIKHSGIDSKNIIPLPIMDRTFYNRFGYIYHPEYNHFYGDQELCRVGTMLGKKIELPILFEHIHHLAGKTRKDHVNIKNDKFHASDKETFLRREANGFDLVKLSILIPATYDRQETLNNLLTSLQRQIKENNVKGEVEILADIDNYQKTVGAKRNNLLKNAKGEFALFIDSDDRIADNYLSLILKGIKTNPDCISLNGILKQAGKPDKVFKHSISYKGWYENNGILFRYINHLNCIKTSIARKVNYPLINKGEDKSYSQALERSGLLRVEYNIPSIIYFYDYVKKPFSK